MYRCVVCGYCYLIENGDPTQEIAPGTEFDDLPETWQCPVCHVGKEYFVGVDNE